MQAINKEFFEEVLGEPVLEIKIEAGCRPEDNVAGSLKSITATTLGDGKQYHFIFKTFPENLTKDARTFIVSSKAFRRETEAYKTVFPELERFAKSKGFDYQAPIPKFYRAHNDDENDYLLLEDLRGSGYKMPDKAVSLSLEQVSMVMQECAKLHAVSHAYLSYEGERVFQEIDGFQFFYMDEVQRETINSNFEPLTKQFFSAAADTIQSKNPEGATKMKRYMKDIGRLRSTLGHLTDKSVFPTICHVDLWTNNMLFKYNNIGEPIGVKFIDFQFSQRGNIFSDLTYFLYSSTTPEFRRQHLLRALNLYYDEFCKTMDELITPLPIGFSRGFFIDTFQSCIGPAFARFIFCAGMQLKMRKGGNNENDMDMLSFMEKSNEENPWSTEHFEALVREMVDRKVI